MIVSNLFSYLFRGVSVKEESSGCRNKRVRVSRTVFYGGKTSFNNFQRNIRESLHTPPKTNKKQLVNKQALKRSARRQGSN